MKREREPGLYLVLDGPPGPTSGRFVELEDETGASVGLRGAKWVPEGDLWTLGPIPVERVHYATSPQPGDEGSYEVTLGGGLVDSYPNLAAAIGAVREILRSGASLEEIQVWKRVPLRATVHIEAADSPTETIEFNAGEVRIEVGIEPKE